MYQRQVTQHAKQMNSITIKPKLAIKREQPQCVLHLLLIGIQPTLDARDAHLISLHSTIKQSNVKLALLAQYGQLFITYVYLDVSLNKSTIMITKNALK